MCQWKFLYFMYKANISASNAVSAAEISRTALGSSPSGELRWVAVRAWPLLVFISHPRDFESSAILSRGAARILDGLLKNPEIVARKKAHLMRRSDSTYAPRNAIEWLGT